jgi:hypothetical protein
MQITKKDGLKEMLSHKKIFGLFIILALVYAGQSLLMPPDQTTLDRYDISRTQLSLILLTIILPYIVIWFIALRGYLSLRVYTQTIKASRDGRAFNLIAKGLLALALWMPVTAIVTAQTDYLYQADHSLTPLMIMLQNYLNLVIISMALLLIYKGSLRLLKLVRKTPVGLPLWFLLTYIGLAALYVFLVLHDPARQAPTQAVEVATYYLPDWLIMTTIVIPRLLMWFLGAQAAYNIITYSLKVKGTIYKEALGDLAKGIGWVVVSVIALRCFQSLSGPMGELGLPLMLLIIYALLALIAVGYVFISRGARKLKRIEEF